MKRSALLNRYNRMRNFTRTQEPRGVAARAAGRSFVVQKHDATALHYDFRLELDGVLKSWAVPKGPSLSPADKRLAMEVEDHPVSYRDFEGTIAEGGYGAGPVIVWDRGAWQPVGDPHEGLRKGALKFDLEGEKLRGQFSLVRLPKRGKRPAWLLIKRSDVHARRGKQADITALQPQSVISGRGIEDVGTGSGTPAGKRRAKSREPLAKAKRKAKAPKAKAARSATDFAGVRITHPDRVMDTASHTTKLDLARYHQAVNAWVMPYATHRPVALVRCPEGDAQKCFFQKRAARGMSKAIKHRTIEGNEVVYVTDARGWYELVQFNTVEFHGWGARLPGWRKPDWVVFDLDPDPSVPFARVIEAAREVRERLSALKLRSFVKTTGGKGLHVVVPIAEGPGWDKVKAFAEDVANRMVAESPDAYVATMSKKKREGKIFIDWLRNGAGATAVLPYSPRARPGCTVALPVEWDALDGVDPREFTVASVPGLLAKRRKDPWADFLGLKQKLPKTS